MELHEYVAKLAEWPYEWGQTDCVLAAASWVAVRRGVDPADGLRGSYSSPEECAAVTRAGGGLPVLVARRMRAAGVPRTDDPQPGDVAVVRMRGNWWGAIRGHGGRWVIKCTDGVVATKNVRVVAVWRVG